MQKLDELLPEQLHLQEKILPEQLANNLADLKAASLKNIPQPNEQTKLVVINLKNLISHGKDQPMIDKKIRSIFHIESIK
jgi:selenocysteine lyase/cysteine desulfurase